MIINNKNLSTYGGELLSKKIQPSSFKKESYFGKKSIIPITLSDKFEYGLIEASIILKAQTEDLLKENESNLTKDISKSIISFTGEALSYKCLFESAPGKEVFFDNLEGKYAVEKQITLIILEKFKTEVTETINRVISKIITVTGNQTTPCIVEITPISDIIDITLEGLADDPIIIKNLKANKKVIIDGVEQLVTVDGVNKYGDTDMWDFPRLVPGVNNIKVSRNTCDISIKYKPRFI